MSEIEESARVAALHRLGLLDSPASKTFDQVTRLAAAALSVPIVLVSLVDEKRQWFKSRVGLDAVETPRAISFCAHAVTDRSPLVVKDATLDIRFANNPMVTGAPHVRAYAGIPLYTSDGHAIGALCAIDRRPRNFTEVDLNTLRDAARAIEVFIHAEEATGNTDSSAASIAGPDAQTGQALHLSFHQASVGLVHFSPNGRVLRVNPPLCRTLGLDSHAGAGLSLAELIHPEDIGQATMCLDQLLVGERNSCRMEARLLRRDGSSLWADVAWTITRDDAGRPQYLIAAIEDLSDSRGSELGVQTSTLLESTHALRSYVKRHTEFEAAARGLEDRFRASSEYAPVLVSHWNGLLRCEYANDAHAYWLDQPSELVIGTSMQEALGSAFARIEFDVRLALQGRARQAAGTLRVRDTCSFNDVHCLPDADGAPDGRGLYLVLLSPHAKAGTGRMRAEGSARVV